MLVGVVLVLVVLCSTRGGGGEEGGVSWQVLAGDDVLVSRPGRMALVSSGER